MAKRFIDTGLFDDSWFFELSPDAKLFWVYLITNCDHAGIIDLSVRLAEFKTGIKELGNSYQRVRKELGNRLVSLKNGNYHFLPKFVRFQYPKGLSINVKPQKAVIDRLKEFNIDPNSLETVTKELANSLVTVQDKDRDRDKDKYKDELSNKGNRNFQKIDFPEISKTYPDQSSFESEIEKWMLEEHSYILNDLDRKENLPNIKHFLNQQYKAKEGRETEEAELIQGFQFVITHLDSWVKSNKFSLSYISKNWQEIFQGSLQRSKGPKNDKPKGVAARIASGINGYTHESLAEELAKEL